MTQISCDKTMKIKNLMDNETLKLKFTKVKETPKFRTC